MPSARIEYKDFKSATLYQGSGGRRKACRHAFTKNTSIILRVQKLFVTLRATTNGKEKMMETKKFKQVPSINRIGERNPNIPLPVIVRCGAQRQKTHERTITRTMRTDSRPISAGEPINWDEVYS
jgi:hypothetical protein